jgi:hypothetical protein
MEFVDAPSMVKILQLKLSHRQKPKLDYDDQETPQNRAIRFDCDTETT